MYGGAESKDGFDSPTRYQLVGLHKLASFSEGQKLPSYNSAGEFSRLLRQKSCPIPTKLKRQPTLAIRLRRRPDPSRAVQEPGEGERKSN
jgi:hypothetical protein